jgi:hypothetical protein
LRPTQGNAAGADHERLHGRASEDERQVEVRPHRNFPAPGAATRKATYSTMTTAKVRLE